MTGAAARSPRPRRPSTRELDRLPPRLPRRRRGDDRVAERRVRLDGLASPSSTGLPADEGGDAIATLTGRGVGSRTALALGLAGRAAAP